MIKKELRNKFRAVRDEISDRGLKSDVIARKLLNNELFKACSDVFLYFSSGTEVSTTEIFKSARDLGKRVAYPKCIDADGNMEFYYVDSIEDLHEGMYGIFEPYFNAERKATPSADSLVVVPGLAFDKCGYRLGYGKGYYDRYLSEYSCTALGIAFEECVCCELPYGIYDIKIDCLITDEEEYYFN